jgi:hypothetical protein
MLQVEWAAWAEECIDKSSPFEIKLMKNKGPLFYKEGFFLIRLDTQISVLI